MRTVGRSLTLRVSAWEADLQARVARMTQRERFLVLALGGLVLFAIVFLPFSWAADQRERLAIAQAQSDEARLTATRASDPTSTARQTARLEDLDGLSLRAETISIARILIEQRLVESAAASELSLSSITVAADIASGPTPLLQAEFTAPYSPQTFWRMLDSLAASPEAVFVDTIEVSSAAGAGVTQTGLSQASGQARVALSFPVAIGPSTGREPRAES